MKQLTSDSASACRRRDEHEDLRFAVGVEVELDDSYGGAVLHPDDGVRRPLVGRAGVKPSVLQEAACPSITARLNLWRIILRERS